MKKKFTTTLDEEILKKLKIKSIETGKSVSEILEELVIKHLDEV